MLPQSPYLDLRSPTSKGGEGRERQGKEGREEKGGEGEEKGGAGEGRGRRGWPPPLTAIPGSAPGRNPCC